MSFRSALELQMHLEERRGEIRRKKRGRHFREETVDEEERRRGGDWKKGEEEKIVPRDTFHFFLGFDTFLFLTFGT